MTIQAKKSVLAKLTAEQEEIEIYLDLFRKVNAMDRLQALQGDFVRVKKMRAMLSAQIEAAEKDATEEAAQETD